MADGRAEKRSPRSAFAVRSARLGSIFDPKRNGLNALRLALACSVIVFHSFPLSGTEIGSAPVRQLLERVGVDSFFALSGFLILSSWLRNPAWAQFLRARALRILPAFWVCLIVTAAVFAPLAALIRGRGFPQDFGAEAVGYVLNNFLLRMNQYGIAGTPQGVPYEGVWDGSLWTLFWEFLCYLGILVVGVAGLLRFRVTLPLLFLIAVVGVLLTSYGPIENFYIDRGSRLGIMFLAGALVYQFRDAIPVGRWWLTGALVIVVVSAWLPDYRVIAALPLGYLMICIGALATHPRWSIRNDVSYGVYIYGMPVQQLLATLGVASASLPVFMLISLVATLPVAAASWFLIEKPALRLKGRRPVSRAPVPPEVPRDG